MGFMDKLKGAVNAVTGGGAKVTIEYDPKVASPGDTLKVKIVATSTGQEIKSKGVFVDLAASESVRLPKGTVPNVELEVSASKESFSKEFKIAPDFVLAAKETKMWEGTVQVPAEAQPTFVGHYTSHEWHIRGRIEARGNDPDSGFLPFKMGLKT